MSEWPQFSDPAGPLVNVSVQHPYSLGSHIAFRAEPTSNTWPTANLALFAPFRLPKFVALSFLFINNGAVVSGNFDVGIYDAGGVRLISTGSTAQSTVGETQAVAISENLGPGAYYFALAFNNTSATITGHNVTSARPVLRAAGCAEMAAAFPLPATAVFAPITSFVMPVMGVSARSFV